MAYTAPTNHNDIQLSIHQMVFNRIPFLTQSQANADIISNFIVEVCSEIEPCLQVSWYDDDGNRIETPITARIGDESKYNVAQKSLIADLVAIYILQRIAGLNASGNTVGDDGTVTEGEKTFLKKAVAGSVEVEYDQFDGKKASMQLAASDLLDQFRKTAFRKGRGMGCILDICADCLAAMQEELSNGAKPFIVLGF